MSLPVGWLRVGRSPREPHTGRPCAVCGHADWCTESDDGSVAHCQRVDAGAFRRSPRSGWYHRVGAGRAAPSEPLPAWSAARRAAEAQPAAAARPVAWSTLARRYAAAAGRDAVAALAAELGVSAGSLRRLGVGWAARADCCDVLRTRCDAGGVWTFPMRDGAGRVVGLRTRVPPAGVKRSASGSDGSGLFVPTGLSAGSRQLVACEGPTSCAALLTAGLDAVGRPNCRAGGPYLVALCRRLRPARLVVLGEWDLKVTRPGAPPRPCPNCRGPLGRRPVPGDPCPVCGGSGTACYEWPGWEGAQAVAVELAPSCPDVRAVLPPAGVKDARVWLRAGGLRLGLWQAVNAAEPVRVAGRRTA